MANSDDATAAPPVAANRGSQKMLQLLRRRLRQLLWITAGLAILLTLISGIFGIWWLNSLNGLPDIGDPFDVAALKRFQVPDDQNAFTYLRRADQKLTPLPDLPQAVRATALTIGWSQADPKLRDWADANRPALDLFRRAADQPDGLAHPVGQGFSPQYGYVNPDRLAWLAFLEGARLEELGDRAGAWDCYRAILRVVTHFRRRGSAIERTVANELFGQLRARLETWSANPRTPIPVLRQALEEAIANQPRPEWDAFSLKLDYLLIMSLLERPNHNQVADVIGEDLDYRLGNYQLPSDLAVYVYIGQRLALREPERSRRVIRLVFANWIAHFEDAGMRKTPPAVLAYSSRGRSRLPLYPVSPQAPAGARALTPRETARWVVTTKDADRFLHDWFSPFARGREQLGYHNLIMTLAEELYRREHGSEPPSDKALVGTYLKSLPDDGSADLDQGKTPVVTDLGASDESQPR